MAGGKLIEQLLRFLRPAVKAKSTCPLNTCYNNPVSKQMYIACESHQ
jgi:hypothetical protein